MLETKNEQKRFCPRCNSDQVVKSGLHHHANGVTQRYGCKTCGTTFSHDGYYRGKHPISLIQYAAVLYREGFSYAKIQSCLHDEFNQDVSPQTIGAWIKMLGVQPRLKSSGNQKNKIVRDLIEIGVITTIRFSDSRHPEKFLILDNFVSNLFDKKQLCNSGSENE